MDKISVFAAGKVNLSLNILGKKENLHLLDSVMVSINLGDTITACKRRDNNINVIFEGFKDGIDPQNNTVLKAARCLSDNCGGFGADITIQKNLPPASGLGGSAADAAGALIALGRLFGFKADLPAIAAKVGSDVPFMLKGGAARVGGTGEILTPFKIKLDLFMVVASGKTGCSSRDAYARFDTLTPSYISCPCDNDNLVSLLEDGNPAALHLFSNALSPAAETLCGNIESTRALLQASGAISTVMTGSGSAVVGFFNNALAAQKAADTLSAKGMFAKSCTLMR